MMLVARCALVRHLAAEHGDRFVLKGGALLYHVYGIPRVSFLDTDYAEATTRGNPDVDEIEREIVFTDRENGYSLKTTPDGRWTDRGHVIRVNNLTYTVEPGHDMMSSYEPPALRIPARRSGR